MDRSDLSALAISTICCSARDRRLTFMPGLSGNPSWGSVASARRGSARLFRKGPVVSSSPRKRFSSTVMSGTRLNSWKTALIPRRRASETERKCTGSPWSRTSPASARRAPATILMSVDLPAPFSPKSTCTSPGRRSKSTWSSACTPGNHLLSPRRRSSGGASATSVDAPRCSPLLPGTCPLLVHAEGRLEVRRRQRRLVVERVDVGLVDHVDRWSGVLRVRLVLQDSHGLVDRDPALDHRRVRGRGQDGPPLDVLIDAGCEVVRQHLDLVRLTGVAQSLRRRLSGR